MSQGIHDILGFSGVIVCWSCFHSKHFDALAQFSMCNPSSAFSALNIHVVQLSIQSPLGGRGHSIIPSNCPYLTPHDPHSAHSSTHCEEGPHDHHSFRNARHDYDPLL